MACAERSEIFWRMSAAISARRATAEVSPSVAASAVNWVLSPWLIG